MDNPKNDAYYLNKIIVNLRFVLEHSDGVSKEDFERNEILVDSVMFRLIQISENSDKLSSEIKQKHADIPWKAIKGLRNRIVHEYGHVDFGIIFDTVANDLPVLLGKIEKDFS